MDVGTVPAGDEMGAQRAFRYLQLEPVERHAIIVANLTLLLDA